MTRGRTHLTTCSTRRRRRWTSTTRPWRPSSARCSRASTAPCLRTAKRAPARRTPWRASALVWNPSEKEENEGEEEKEGEEGEEQDSQEENGEKEEEEELKAGQCEAWDLTISTLTLAVSHEQASCSPCLILLLSYFHILLLFLLLYSFHFFFFFFFFFFLLFFFFFVSAIFCFFSSYSFPPPFFFLFFFSFSFLFGLVAYRPAVRQLHRRPGGRHYPSHAASFVWETQRVVCMLSLMSNDRKKKPLIKKKRGGEGGGGTKENSFCFT